MATVVPGGVTGPTRGQSQMQMAQLLQQGVQFGMDISERKRQFDLEHERMNKEFNINKAYGFMTTAAQEHNGGLSGWIGENPKMFSYILEGIGMNPVDTETTYQAIKNQAMTPQQFLNNLTLHQMELSEGNASGFMKEVKASLSSKSSLDRLKKETAPTTATAAPSAEGTGTPEVASPTEAETERKDPWFYEYEGTGEPGKAPADTSSTGGNEFSYEPATDSFIRAATPVIEAPQSQEIEKEGRTYRYEPATDSYIGIGFPEKPPAEPAAPTKAAPAERKVGPPAGNMTLKTEDGTEHRVSRTNIDGKAYFYEQATDQYYEVDTQKGTLVNPMSREDIEMKKEFGLVGPDEYRAEGKLSASMEGLTGVMAMVASDVNFDAEAASPKMREAATFSSAISTDAQADEAAIKEAAKAIRARGKGSGVPQAQVIEKNIKDFRAASLAIDEAIVSKDKGSLNEGIGKYVYNYEKLLSYSDFKALTETSAGRRAINAQIDKVLGDPQTLKMLTLTIEGPSALAAINSAEALANDPVYQEMLALDSQAKYMTAVADIKKAEASIVKSGYDTALLAYKQEIGYDEQVLYNDLIKSGYSVQEAQLGVMMKGLEIELLGMEVAAKEGVGGIDPTALTQYFNLDEKIKKMVAEDPTFPGSPMYKRITKARDLLFSYATREETDGVPDYLAETRGVVGRILEGLRLAKPKETYKPNLQQEVPAASQNTMTKEGSEMRSRMQSELGQ